MFGWLEKKAAQQSLKNVSINTERLILIGNAADEKIVETGMSDEKATKKVVSVQEDLLTNI